MSKTIKLPFSSSHEKGKDTKLRNEITEIVAECCVDLNVPEATSQILSLLEGSLPEGKENVVFMEKHTDRYEKTEEYHLRDKKGIAYIAYGDGWNDCLEEIKEKMK